MSSKHYQIPIKRWATLYTNKIKYKLMTMNKSDLKINPYFFENISNLKYLGVNVNNKSNMHNEIQIRINTANQTYFIINKKFNSNMLSKITKKNFYICYQ